MNKLKFFFFAFIRLPSTILHELLHALPIITFTITDTISNIIKSVLNIPLNPVTKIVSFNLVPEFKSRTLGSIGYINSSPIQSIIINIMPITSWIIMIYGYYHLGYINIDNELSLDLPSYTFIEHAVIILGTIYLSWAGTLSLIDIKNILKGLLSAQTIILVLVIIGGFYAKDLTFLEFKTLINSALKYIKSMP